MRKFRYARISDEPAEINLSPLIDMMFLLLIFFIVTAVFVEEVGVQIQRPTASTVESLEKKSIMIGITKEGKVVYGGREIGLNGVRCVVSQLNKGVERSVIIIADEGSRSGMLVDVIDECKAAGAKQVSIATEEE